MLAYYGLANVSLKRIFSIIVSPFVLSKEVVYDLFHGVVGYELILENGNDKS